MIDDEDDDDDVVGTDCRGLVIDDVDITVTAEHDEDDGAYLLQVQ